MHTDGYVGDGDIDLPEPVDRRSDHAAHGIRIFDVGDMTHGLGAEGARLFGVHVPIGREDGATLVTGGERATGNGLDKGYFVKPTVFDHVTPDMRIAREEIFGPVLSVLRVKDFDEAMQVANKTGEHSYFAELRIV